MSMSLGKAEINVTPLIDVLLVLIIIFMVVLPQHSAGLPAVVPQPASPDVESIPNDQDIIVSVNKDRSISINQQPIAIERLQESERCGYIPFRFELEAGHTAWAAQQFGVLSQAIDDLLTLLVGGFSTELDEHLARLMRCRDGRQ